MLGKLRFSAGEAVLYGFVINCTIVVARRKTEMFHHIKSPKKPNFCGALDFLREKMVHISGGVLWLKVNGGP